jgi:hypothetical protein
MVSWPSPGPDAELAGCALECPARNTLRRGDPNDLVNEPRLPA